MVMLLLSATYSDWSKLKTHGAAQVQLEVPSMSTSFVVHVVIAVLIVDASSPLCGGIFPVGLTDAQVVVRAASIAAIPPTFDSPAFFQFAKASL
jgi:hypothetical protein